jgi:hypothetical protein
VRASAWLDDATRVNRAANRADAGGTGPAHAFSVALASADIEADAMAQDGLAQFRRDARKLAASCPETKRRSP